MMFCPKCGTKALDSATFCQKCGAKLIVGDTTQQADISTPVRQTQNIPLDIPQKKKLGKMPIILGAAALVIVGILIAAIYGNVSGQKGEEHVSKSEIATKGSTSERPVDTKSTDWKIPYADKVLELMNQDSVPMFNIINLTDSDIPSLVVDYSGYSVSVFTWNGESLVTVIEDWPYGAGGNLGYEYLPGGNVIRNYNNDQAGAIVYESYMQLNDAREVVDLYDESLSIWYFKDTNSNGLMDENEPYSEEPYYYYGEKEITEKEYSSYQIAGDYEQLTGDKSVEATLSQLGVEIEGGNQAVGEILYKGQAIAGLLGSTPEELNKIFGNPTGGTPVTGEFLYGGTEYYIYDGISFMLGDQGTAVNITVAADVAEINGATLDQNRTGIINLLGTPGYEEKLPEDESGEGLGGYYIMEYTFYEDLTIITVEMPDADSNANTVRIVRYDDGLGDEEYQQSSTDADDSNATQNAGVISFTDMLGKWQWRGQDVVDAALGIGGTKQLTLYSNGTCEGQIATSGSVNGEFIMAFAPDEWSYLEYEQILQVSALTTGWDWNSNGTPVQVPVYKTLNFRVSMSGNSLRLENVDNPDSKNIEYIKAN